jgi:hypothetical protein
MKCYELFHPDQRSQSPVKSSTLIEAPVRSLSISLLVHLIIVILAGSFAIYRVTQEAPEFVASSGGLLSDIPIEPMKATEPETPSVNIPNPSSAPVQATSNLDTVITTANSSFSIGTAVKAPQLTGLGEGDIAGAGKGLGTVGTGIGRAGSTMRLFGTAAKGNSVVVCFDVSGSMLSGRGKSEKTYAKLEAEIVRLIGTFDLKTSFNLVAFSHDGEVYRDGTLVRATSDEKQRAIAWLKKKTPMVMRDPKASEQEKAAHRGTRADLALSAALQLQPDIIFFVSDGEPTGMRPDDILQLVSGAQQTQKKATINAIAYLADGGQRFMKSLAERNNGTYQEVNPGDTE